MNISVVIPCYNAGTQIEDAVKSVLCQKGNFVVSQVILVDDASTDPTTIKTLHSLSRLPQVEVHSHCARKGPGAARNTGIAYVKAEWLTFLDADDVFTEDSLEVRLRAARAFPDCAWFGGDFAICRVDGTVEEPFFFARPTLGKYVGTAFATKKPIRLAKPIRPFLDVALTHMCSSLFLADAVRSIGGFSEKTGIQEDYHFLLRLAKRFDYVFVPEVVFLYRRHSSNLTRSAASVYSWRARALKDLMHSGELLEYKAATKKKVAGLYLARAYELRRAGRFPAATVSCAQSVFYDPQNRAAWRCLAASVLKE